MISNSNSDDDDDDDDYDDYDDKNQNCTFGNVRIISGAFVSFFFL